MLDLLVIGAGLSGLSAALSAAQAGLRVRVVAKGLGSLHWHAGTLDVLGYLPGRATPVTDPFAAIAELAQQQPQHPYARLGAARVSASLARFADILAAANLPFGRADADALENGEAANLLLPSPVGAPRPTWRAPLAQLAGDLASAQPMLIVGFTGMRDFYPALIADNLTRLGTAARAAWLPLATLTTRRDSNTVHLAQALDDPATVAALVQALRPLLRPGERVGLPAILGLERHAATLAQVQAGLDAPVFEIPTLPPSVPGIRLHGALVGALADLGVRVEAGMTAQGAQHEQRTIRSVETATGSRPLQHRARAFLLATGGILGGGFQSDHQGRIWETVFGLPLAVPATREAWFRAEFLDPRGHPVFSGGIAVNEQFQPLAPEATSAGNSGAPGFDNLWAAGNGLAHADSIRERSVEGLAIATGMAAAQAVSETLDAVC